MQKFFLENHTKNLKDIHHKGVYLIEHKDTSLKYIGSTKTSFNIRWRQHLSELSSQKAHRGNPILKNIISKYGIMGLTFKVLEILDDKPLEYIREREKYWIQYYDSYHNGANCTEETKNIFDDPKVRKKIVYTEELKQQQLLSSPTKITIYVYDKKGNLCYEFLSCSACDRFFKIKIGATNWIVNHTTTPLSIHGEYYPSKEKRDWIPEEIVVKNKKLSAAKTAKVRRLKNSYKIDQAYKDKIRLGHKDRKKVLLCTLDNKAVKVFNSLNECDDFLCLTRGATSKVLKGKAKTLKRIYIPRLI